MSIPVSYIEQALPTVFGQVARTVDPVRRSTYDTDDTGKFVRAYRQNCRLPLRN